MRLLKWMALSVVMGVLAACSASTAPALAPSPTDAPLAKPVFIFLWQPN